MDKLIKEKGDLPKSKEQLLRTEKGSGPSVIADKRVS
jgi:hypothetical protein